MDNYPEITSVRLTEEYYNNNRELFFDCMDDKLIWIGPGIHQYIEGKQNLVNAFEAEHNTLKFRTTQMSSKTISGANGSTCEVLLKYVVYTYYQSGHISTHNQRVTLLWKKVKRNGVFVWKYTVMHISNGMDGDERDNIYPLHLDEYETRQFNATFDNLTKQQHERLIVRGEDYSTYYIEYPDIQFIRGGKAIRSEIHTRDKVINARLLIDELCKILPEQFYRPHRSYIVNVYEIANLSRCKITLRDDTEIPIPPKRYNEVAKDIKALLEKLCKTE